MEELATLNEKYRRRIEKNVSHLANLLYEFFLNLAIDFIIKKIN